MASQEAVLHHQNLHNSARFRRITFATTLDLNIGYYANMLNHYASKICTIIFPWGKYSYLRLPMGIAGSPDIFQAKMSELMVAPELVRTYIDDLLCITWVGLNGHLENLKWSLPGCEMQV